MLKFKVVFIMAVVVFILVMCAFAPGICIERFLLPEGCCEACGGSSSSCSNICMVEEGGNCVCR